MRDRVSRAMLQGIEDALWLPAWASAAEEEGEALPRNITRETAPRGPREVRVLARRYAQLLMRLNHVDLRQIHKDASIADGSRESDPESLGYYLSDPESLGYYLTMQGLGHGVGWDDDHARFDVRIPGGEVYAVRGRGGRWSLDGYVSDRFKSEMKAFRSPSPAVQKARRAVEHAFSHPSPGAWLVASDAAEEAGEHDWADSLRAKASVKSASRDARRRVRRPRHSVLEMARRLPQRRR